MEEDEDMTPFWLQSTTTTSSTARRIRRRSSSLLLNSGVLLIILLVIAAAFIFIIIPSFLSFTSQIFRPQSVKKSWDTLNLVLVLFAIVCGFLSRNSTTNETPRSASSQSASPSYVQKPSFESITPRRGSFSTSNNNGGLSRLRSFSSYPDLRAEEASWMRNESDYPWRFYDDTHLYNYRSSSLNDQPFHPFKPQQKLQDLKQEEEQVVEEVVKIVDDISTATTTFVVESEKEVVYTPTEAAETPPLPPPSAPAPPLPKSVRRKVVRRATTYQDVAKKSSGEGKRKIDEDLGRVSAGNSSPPPPPRLPSPPQVEESESRNEKKRGTTSATKEFLTSLRRNKKKKKQRQKSVENLDSFFNYESSYPLPPPPSRPPQLTPPPPPPPPPPPRFFQNLFSPKKRKDKKIHSVPPPPPPPPPQKTQFHSSSASKPKLLSQNVSKNAPLTTHKPPLPVKIRSYNNVEETVSSGNESPLMSSIPPPPPLPPFNMPVWKFEVVEGDFVRLKSTKDSDFDEANLEESSSPSEAADFATSSPLFCPSPDVNTKADKFIARFRAGLQLEKMNSVKERGKSNLGPS